MPAPRSSWTACCAMWPVTAPVHALRAWAAPTLRARPARPTIRTTPGSRATAAASSAWPGSASISRKIWASAKPVAAWRCRSHSNTWAGRGDPDLSRRQLRIHDDLRRVVQLQRQNAAAARAVDPDIGRVDGELQHAQRRLGPLVELGFGHVRLAAMRSVDLGILTCAGILTGACGVKGPLYLPNVPRDAPWPYVKPQEIGRAHV